MNTIKPQYHIIKNQRGKQGSSFNKQSLNQVSFKAAPSLLVKKIGTEIADNLPVGKLATKYNIVSEADEPIIKIFDKYFGEINRRVVGKVNSLYGEFKDKGPTPRFDIDKGITSIKEKNILRSFWETLIFPFVTLPKWGFSWGLKQAKKFGPTKKLATKLYEMPKVRAPRKIHELDEKTDVLQGMYQKTNQFIKDFASKKGIDINELKTAISQNDKSYKYYDEADKYLKENLYKVSNKFFDKHTGNFNTAYERPLNRIVSGLIPVAFLANDAYNLSVLCGDTKDVSTKEAKERQKQEISRVFTTAFFQLLMFGAFTKSVNTKPYFAPLASAGTVLVSETSSRARLGKPIFFLSKDKAKEYNKKQKEKELELAKNPEEATFKGKIEALKDKFTSIFDKKDKEDDKFEDKLEEIEEQIEEKIEKELEDKKQIKQQNTQTVNQVNDNSSNGVAQQTEPKVTEKSNNTTTPVKTTNLLEQRLNAQNSFKAKVDDKTSKNEPKKALISMDLFKKGLAILTVGGFVLSFIKNSSFTKNSAPMKAIKNIGSKIKSKIYDPYAFKDFKFSNKKFDDIMGALKEVGFSEVVDGHMFIKEKYAKTFADGTFKMMKTTLPSDRIPKTVDNVIETLTKKGDFNISELKSIRKTLSNVLNKNSSLIGEKNYSEIADTVAKVLDLPSSRVDKLKNAITNSIAKEVTEEAIKVETKIKPLLDLFTEPFKFIVYIGGMPFKIVSSALKAMLSPITQKIAQNKKGNTPLKGYEKVVERTLKELFGEKSPRKQKTSQNVFINTLESLNKKSRKYIKASGDYGDAMRRKVSGAEFREILLKRDEEAKTFKKYVRDSIEKSFNGVTQSSNKNTDLAMLSKLSSSLVTSAFLVADNYNMVMIKSDGEDKEDAKEKANERIIQRLSALFYQTMFINLFNSTFRSTYNSSLKGMAAVVAPNTITTEVVTRASIGMPIKRKTHEELLALEEKNENREGLIGKYFKFMRLLTGKKPLKDRLPKDKVQVKNIEQVVKNTNSTNKVASTNLLEKHSLSKKQ